MGMYPIGILAYGYDLGGSEHGWRTVDGRDPKHHVWYDKDEGFQESAEVELLRVIANFTERWTPESRFWERRHEAEQEIKVSVVRYGSYDYSGYILATRVYRGPGGGAVNIDFPPAPKEDDSLLREALDILNITPTSNVGWILATFYG